ncbi:ABC transporter substrate-binding protein [Bartonella sp. M0280]|nr:ABC transporter substrate-binding protein [Bartonella apihabitans]
MNYFSLHSNFRFCCLPRSSGIRRLSVVMCIFLAVTTTPQSASAKKADVFPESAKIISVGGAVTEIVYALGAGEQLIARDTTSSYPDEVQKLPDVGYMRNLSPEGILSLAPDAILLDQGSGPASTVEILENASIPMLEVPEHFTREGVREKIEKIGQALHRQDKAEALIKEVEREFAKNDQLIKDHSDAKRILFVLTVQNGRLMAAGKDTAADGIIRLSGARNAIDGYNGYKLLTDEAIINSSPDLILMMGHSGISATVEDLYKIPAVETTPAFKHKAIKQMDGLYLLGFGPRTPLAVREVIDALYKYGQ